jgi:hypothetical protein
MRATPSGWVMKSSPDLRSWPAWLSQAKAKARSISCRSMGSAVSDLCSSMTAKRSPSRARWSAVSSFVIASARGVRERPARSPTRV